MGVSTNAILFWGILLEGAEGDLNVPWDDETYDGEWEEYYLNLHEVFYPDNDASKEVRNAYWSRYRELITNMPCGIDRHCSGDYPLRYTFVRDSRTIARRGYPEELISLDVGEDWEEKLKEFCKIMGLNWQEPQWWLVSYWG